MCVQCFPLRPVSPGRQNRKYTPYFPVPLSLFHHLIKFHQWQGLRYFSSRFNCLTWNLAKCNWCREWGDLSVSLAVVCSPSAWRVPCPFSKRYSVCICHEANTLWVFLRENEMLVLFSGICSHTRKRDKKEIAMQGAKVNKLGFTLQYTCMDKNEARFKRGISYVLPWWGNFSVLAWKADVEG